MSATVAQKPFVISRIFNAPREIVFNAFTRQEEMQKWFSPKGFTVISAKMDLRVGGIYHYGLRAPDDTLVWGKFVYREIVRPERVTWVHSFSDENGGVTRHPMAPVWPLEMLATLTLEDLGGKTRFTVSWLPINPTEAEQAAFDAGRNGMTQGWTGTLDQLGAHLATA